MLCFVYVSQHNTKEWEREENILVLIKTSAILKMSSNLKEPSIIVALKSLIENLLCNIVGLTKTMSVIVRWFIPFKTDDFNNFTEHRTLIKLSMSKV